MMIYLYMTTTYTVVMWFGDFSISFIGLLYIVSSDMKSYAVLFDYYMFVCKKLSSLISKLFK